MTSINVTAGMALGLALALAGCSSQPLGPDGGSETVSSVQEEISINSEASQKMRLISRLYVSDYAALEWYQPAAGVVGFSVVQDASQQLLHEVIDAESLRSMKPTQVFKKYARSLEVPEALVKLEAQPDALQELQQTDEVERFSPEEDLQIPGVLPQTAFQISQADKAFNCEQQAFRNQLCSDSNWDATVCAIEVHAKFTRTFNGVDESQTAVCSRLGTNTMFVGITGCQTLGGTPEPPNRCSNNFVFGAGTTFDVSQGFIRSWHGVAQTYFFADDAYNHTGTGNFKGNGVYQYVTRVFAD